MAGISGNVTGTSAQFAQNMVVNYVQQQGAGYIGGLVAKGDIKEGDPLHSALHAMVGCAGAAASSQRCSAGALGGAASSVLTHLFQDTDPGEKLLTREAKRNVLASLVTGIAAVSDVPGATAANNAAVANIDNNWLATQQEVQRNREIAEAPTVLDKLRVMGKWAHISIAQDLLTARGVAKGFTEGMADAGLDTLNGAAGFMRDPVGSVQAMAAFVSSPEAIEALGATAAAALQSQLNELDHALKIGGEVNAERLGQQIGQTVGLMTSIVVSGGAGASSGSASKALLLSRMGIDVSSSEIKALAAASGDLPSRVPKLEGVWGGI